MFPNNPNSPHPTEPASLPAVSPASQQQPASAIQPSPATQSIPAGDVTIGSVAQAKQLAQQYINDPYRLSEAISQLKASYQANQYHITPNQVEN